ncbi:MAG TPA: Spy/CpxP family protein refolding chaperone [Bryobacteraceae bacterium]|jgi:Spy/CpxP family protein refolding chaperone|nr:Spy/CpxP family protein refolding chaperone [Bryobacteraceae bacterium]
MKFGLFLPAVLAAGMAVAQTTPPANTQANTPAKTETQTEHRRPMMMRRLTADLNLTPQQQTEAKKIFDSSWQQRKALTPKLREERGAVLNAIKTDNVGEIDHLIQANSQLNAQAAEIHAKAMAQFYAMLNPAQKAKMDQKMAHFMHPMAPEHHAPAATNSR